MFAHFGMKTFYPSGDHMGYGKGDIVKNLIDACRKGGVYFGLYMSIIDKHFEGAGSPNHADYGSYYFDQLKELSTKYGPIDEYWFDDFNTANLKMDYPKIGKMIAETQPNAVVYDSGMLVKTIPDRCIAWPNAHGGVKPDQEYRKNIDGFILQEYIPLGQRVDGYTIECRVNGQWTPVFSGKKIGHKRIILEDRSSAKDKQFPAADAVRVRIDKSLACPLINNIQIIGKLH